MDFKEDFMDALKAGANYVSLLEVVDRHQKSGLTPQVAYSALEQIWLEFGFDGSDETSPMRDELEFVMEKVWFQGPKEPVNVP